MKKNARSLLILFSIFLFAGCGKSTTDSTAPAAEAPADGGQSTVQDDLSQPNVVQIAMKSPDHTTLVAALKAADYVDVLVNAGPFTVFAPTNAAFDQLPAGTLDDLLKPENKSKLQDILEYHVYVGVIHESMVDGEMALNQVNSKNATFKNENGKLSINGANVMASLPASNGIIYVIDKVLLPPQ